MLLKRFNNCKKNFAVKAYLCFKSLQCLNEFISKADDNATDLITFILINILKSYIQGRGSCVCIKYSLPMLKLIYVVHPTSLQFN